jgi:hypothetical protein
MRFIVVKDEQSLTELQARALGPGLSAELRASAERAIRAANPDLDLDALRPGLVVALPDEVQRTAERTPELGTSPDLLAGLDRVIGALPGTGSATNPKARPDLGRVLASAEVRKLADADEAVRDAVSRAVAVLAAANKRAAAQEEALAKAVAQWQRDLAQMRDLLA